LAGLSVLSTGIHFWGGAGGKDGGNGGDDGGTGAERAANNSAVGRTSQPVPEASLHCFHCPVHEVA
tara:strand:+ start:373 stop:570 length:198 start_codon:yes stop_codon:yes gene_type:complete